MDRKNIVEYVYQCEDKIKEETGWSDEIIDNIANMKQYEVLKNAGLKEVEINGEKYKVRN